MDGEPWANTSPLTEQERPVAALLAQGRHMDEIAAELGFPATP